MSDPKKSNNLKTALMLASVAFLFAVAILVKQLWLR